MSLGLPSENWHLTAPADYSQSPHGVSISRLQLQSGSRELLLQGTIAREGAQDFNLILSRLDLAALQPARDGLSGPPGKRVPISGEIIAALGAKPIEAYFARDLLAIFSTEAEVAALRPNLDLVGALDAFAVIASAQGDQVDFVSRFFAPRAGIPEDPVTGSAHCRLIPYWAGRLGKDVLVARQIPARGGELTCEKKGDRVLIAGDAVAYLRGRISV